MYAMVDELVDFVFGGGGGSDGGAVVFLFEMLRNLYILNQVSHTNLKGEKKFFTRSRLSRSSTTHRAH